MPDLGRLADALDMTVGRAAAWLGDAAVGNAAAVARTARRREGYVDGSLLVAFAGGTGSGKSSLVNALAGAGVMSVSPVRPHTGAPEALVAVTAEPGLDEVFEDLGVRVIRSEHGLAGLVLVDLPDTDSVVSSHQAAVRRFLPQADLVVWVVDPEKYRDEDLLRSYVEPMAPYQDQFVFALNQVDRVAESAPLVDDLTTALQGTGIADPVCFALAADPPGGSPQGIGALRRHLDERRDRREMAVHTLLADVRGVTAELAAAAGIDERPTLDFERRWEDTRTDAAEVLLDGRVGAREDAACRVEDFVAALTVDAGPAGGSAVFAAVDGDAVSAALDSAAAAVTEATAGSSRGWLGGIRPQAHETGVATAAGALDMELGGELRSALRGRAELAATLAWVAVETAQVEAAHESATTIRAESEPDPDAEGPPERSNGTAPESE